MSLILSGTDGLSDVDGTAATPAIRGTDANTGIFFPAADTIAFAEGGVEAMRIDSSGRVGIGTTSPSAKLDVRGSSTFLVNATNPTAWVSVDSALTTGSMYNQWNTTSSVGITGTYTNHPHTFVTNNNERMRIDSSGNVGIGTSSPSGKLHVSGGSNPQIVFDDAASRTYGIGVTSSAMSFYDVTGAAERMRIDSSGNLLVGQTSGNADARVSIDAGSTDSSPVIDFRKGSATTTTAQVYARFFCNGGAVATGSITANGVSAATFTGYSDRRLKENIVDLPSQLSNIMALRPVEFDFKGYENGEGHQIGFIAQEVQEIYPDSVGEGADGMLTLSDMNKNDARLIKAIQEMKTIMDAQATTITALTARIEALETQSADNPPQGETP